MQRQVHALLLVWAYMSLLVRALAAVWQMGWWGASAASVAPACGPSPTELLPVSWPILQCRMGVPAAVTCLEEGPASVAGGWVRAEGTTHAAFCPAVSVPANQCCPVRGCGCDACLASGPLSSAEGMTGPGATIEQPVKIMGVMETLAVWGRCHNQAACIMLGRIMDCHPMQGWHCVERTLTKQL